MKHRNDIFRKVTAAVMLTAVAAVLPSCSATDEPAPLPGSGLTDVSVAFTFTVSDTAGDESALLSRATPTDGPYDRGSGYENYINVEGVDFRFYFYSSDDRFIGQVPEVTLQPEAESPGSKTYKAIGTLTSAQSEMTSFKVCILANWKTYPQPAPFSPLSDLWKASQAIYDYAGNELSATNTIPLYGIREFTGVTFASGVRTELGQIHLLRAFAKIEVELTPSVRPVESLVITRVNDLGYKCPTGVSAEGDYVHGSYEADYVATPYIPSGVQVSERPMRLVEGEAGKEETRRFVAYVPEYDNRSADAVKSRIRINYVNGANPLGDTDYIDFKYYDAAGIHAKDEVFDLLRNGLYRYKVTQNRVVVDVQPYAEVELKPEYGFERDEDGNIIVRNEKGEIVRIVKTDDQQLILKPFEVANIGEATGVFDTDDRVLMAYLPDGRTMIYNYQSDDHSQLVSWEIYSNEDGEYGMYLEEDYEKTRYDYVYESYVDMFCHNFYDNRGTLIEEYRYASHSDFENRPGKGQGNCVKTVTYTAPGDINAAGSLHGEKDVYHYDYSSRKCILKIEIRLVTVTKTQPALNDDGSLKKDSDGNQIFETVTVDEWQETRIENPNVYPSI